MPIAKLIYFDPLCCPNLLYLFLWSTWIRLLAARCYHYRQERRRSCKFRPLCRRQGCRACVAESLPLATMVQQTQKRTKRLQNEQMPVVITNSNRHMVMLMPHLGHQERYIITCVRHVGFHSPIFPSPPSSLQIIQGRAFS